MCRDQRADRTLLVTERGAKVVAGWQLQGIAAFHLQDRPQRSDRAGDKVPAYVTTTVLRPIR
jgi:hypothetical protein